MFLLVPEVILERHVVLLQLLQHLLKLRERLVGLFEEVLALLGVCVDLCNFGLVAIVFSHELGG